MMFLIMNSNEEEVVKAMFCLAHNLVFTVTAEGVETEESFKFKKHKDVIRCKVIYLTNRCCQHY